MPQREMEYRFVQENLAEQELMEQLARIAQESGAKVVELETR